MALSRYTLPHAPGSCVRKIITMSVVLVVTSMLSMLMIASLQKVERVYSSANFQRMFLKDELKIENLNTAKQKYIASLKQSTELPKNSKAIILGWTQQYDNKVWFDMTKRLSKCPHKCVFTHDRSVLNQADMVLIQGWKECHLNSSAANGISCMGWGHPAGTEQWDWPHRKVKGQVWVYFNRESQQNSASGSDLLFTLQSFNYTLSFKPDSDVYFPYGFSRKRRNVFSTRLKTDDIKSRLLLWIVSHCNVTHRDNYAEELQKRVVLDQFGSCSRRSDGCNRTRSCVSQLFSKYKFYLAFENSICNHYITEKFWNSLNVGVVPVVLGPKPSFYQNIAPPNSYIHVDDFASPEKVAEYLLYLDSNDTAYQAYHLWREHYSTGALWRPNICELCRLAVEKPAKITHLSNWWNGETECTKVPADLRPVSQKNEDIKIQSEALETMMHSVKVV